MSNVIGTGRFASRCMLTGASSSSRRRGVVGAILVLACLLLLPPPADASDACPTWQAARDLKAARVAHAKAEKRLAEAKRVLSATKSYSATYGSSVGRWTRLARRTGWPWPQFPTLMYVIERESGGNPSVFNYQGSGAAGLLQLAPCHYSGRFDPTDPRANLSYGLKLFRGSGWSPWAL